MKRITIRIWGVILLKQSTFKNCLECGRRCSADRIEKFKGGQICPYYVGIISTERAAEMAGIGIRTLFRISTDAIIAKARERGYIIIVELIDERRRFYGGKLK